MTVSKLFDLHTHSTASDGRLSPMELWQRAQANGVDYMALTDHDTLAGVWQLQRQLAEKNAALDSGLQTQLVPGVEITALIDNLCVHVVGLWLDSDNDPLNAFLNSQQQVRDTRGQHIAAELEKSGIANAYQGAKSMAAGAVLARPHFASYLVEQSICRTMQEAFKRYLGKGKVGDVKCQWPSMQESVAVIRASGGKAVLAHPDKYRISKTKLRHLLDQFAAVGGDSVEIVSGAQKPESTAYLARLTDQRSLSCSTGSDFHGPEQVWCDLGRQPKMPANVAPVWE